MGNDDELLEFLASVLDDVEIPTEDAVNRAVSILATSSLDTELLTLLSDSAYSDAALTLRAEEQTWRVITFSGPSLDIELELDLSEGTTMIGQIGPAQVESLRLAIANRPSVDVAVDDIGRFRIAPVPAEAFRLVATLIDGRKTATPTLTF